MDWCAREWVAGLGLLSERYNFQVRPNIEPCRDIRGIRGKDYSPAPASRHGISFKSRTLWLTTGDSAHSEWLHEVAHLVVCPPWEDGPDSSNEFGGIFAWERAVAKHFRQQGLWTAEDLKSFYGMQDIYMTGETPEDWEASEWGDIRPGRQRTLLSYMNGTLRRCKLLDGNNRPTLCPPDWTDPDLEKRWKVCSDFRTGWPALFRGDGAAPKRSVRSPKAPRA